MNRRLPLVLGAVAALAAAAPGYAADHTVTADETDSASPLWAPADLAVQPGDKVTWSFAGTTLPHNLDRHEPELGPQRAADRPERTAGGPHVHDARHLHATSASSTGPP